MSLKYNDINYQLPAIENQQYLFKHRYFSQELLPYKENEDREVYYSDFN
jgi:hypothetical protein